MFQEISMISFMLLIIVNIRSAKFIQNKYSFQIDTSINSSSWLIGNYKKSHKTLCLVECNLLENCRSVTYKHDLSSANNCDLYSKKFSASELVSNKNTHLYFKECKFNLIKYFKINLLGLN